MATKRNLEEPCAHQKFRPDLYERIRGFTLRLPPLREKRAGLLLLINYFVEKYNEEYKTLLAIPEGAAGCLFRRFARGSSHPRSGRASIRARRRDR